MTSLMRAMVIFCSGALAILGSDASAAAQSASQRPAPEFQTDKSNTTHSGHLKIEWQSQISQTPNGDPPLFYELQQARSETFDNPKTLYTGPNLAYYLSGLPNGDFYYRVRHVDEFGNALSPWSEGIAIRVEHYSKQLTYTLLSIGGIVFVLTVGVVVHGSIKYAS